MLRYVLVHQSRDHHRQYFIRNVEASERGALLQDRSAGYELLGQHRLSAEDGQ